jgi:signal peptidase II
LIAIRFLISTCITVTVDQGSKWFVARFFGKETPYLGSSRVQIKHVKSAGFFVRFMQNRTLLILWGAALLSVIVLLGYGRYFQSAAAQVGLGVAFGGATGNLIDRLWRGKIIDFVDVRFWPVFNIADAAIVLGLGIAFLFI